MAETRTFSVASVNSINKIASIGEVKSSKSLSKTSSSLHIKSGSNENDTPESSSGRTKSRTNSSMKISSDSDETKGRKPRNSKRTSKRKTKEKFVSEAYRVLERRKKELVELIAQPLLLPKTEEIDTTSIEFSKVKLDLMKRVTTASQNSQIHCFVTYPDGDTDVLTVQVKTTISPPRYFHYFLPANNS